MKLRHPIKYYSYLMQLSILSGLSETSYVIRCIRKLNMLKLVLGGVDSVAPFITVNEQSESNRDYSLHTSITLFASGKSYMGN